MMFEKIDSFLQKYDNKEVRFKCEPAGTYRRMRSPARDRTCRQDEYGKCYVGTDIGFNVLMRPVLYGSYHEIEVLSSRQNGERHDRGHDSGEHMRER